MVGRPKYQPSRESDLDVTMTPMIDVVFLLLIFFVWTAGFQVVEYILPSQMSAQAGTSEATTEDPVPEDDFDSVIIRLMWINEQPRWLVNEQPLDSAEQVRQGLDQLAQIKTDAPIIIHPDATVPLGFVIEVYDMAKMAGFEKVSFAVNAS